MLSTFVQFDVSDAKVTPGEVVTALSDHAFVAPRPLSEGVFSGFVAGDHLFDQDFTIDKNILGKEGQWIRWGLRIDTCKAPAALRAACQALEEATAAAQNPSGFASKRQKREARDEVDRKLAKEIAEGKHLRHRLVEIVWDTSRKRLLCGNGSEVVTFELARLMAEAFGVEITRVSAGSLAERYSSSRRALEDLKPDILLDTPPHGASGDVDNGGDFNVPSVPWAANSFSTLDWLGNLAMVWMWWRSLTEPNEWPARIRDHLELHCAYGQRGAVAIKDLNVVAHREAISALQLGMWPRRATILIGSRDLESDWTLSLKPDAWAVSGLRIARHGDEDYTNVREKREGELSQVWGVVDWLDLFMQTFIRRRLDVDRWADERQQLKAWIKAGCKPDRGGNGRPGKPKPAAKKSIADISTQELKAARALIPKEGGVTVSTNIPGVEPVTLDQKSRSNIDKELKRRKQAEGKPRGKGKKR